MVPSCFLHCAVVDVDSDNFPVQLVPSAGNTSNPVTSAREQRDVISRPTQGSLVFSTSKYTRGGLCVFPMCGLVPALLLLDLVVN